MCAPTALAIGTSSCGPSTAIVEPGPVWFEPVDRRGYRVHRENESRPVAALHIGDGRLRPLQPNALITTEEAGRGVERVIHELDWLDGLAYDCEIVEQFLAVAGKRNERGIGVEDADFPWH